MPRFTFRLTIFLLALCFSNAAVAQSGDWYVAPSIIYNNDYAYCAIADSLSGMLGDSEEVDAADAARTPEQLQARIEAAKTEMLRAASALDFEEAIRQRDEVRRLEVLQLELGV